MLKDNLKEVINENICTGVYFEFRNISDLLIHWYENYKYGLKEKKDITYRGVMLNIIYDIVTDENGEVIEETDFVTIRKDLEDQINSINDMFDKGMVK